MDHRKTYQLGKIASTGFPCVRVSRQDSKNAATNVADRLENPTVAYTESGAMLANRIAAKAGKVVTDAAAIVGDKSLNRDSTAIVSATAMVAGKTAGVLFAGHVKELVPAPQLTFLQEQCEEARKRTMRGEKPRVQARKATGADASDGSVAGSDVDTEVSVLSDGAPDDDIAELCKFHSARVKLGLVATEDFTSSYKAFQETQPDSKPAAKPAPAPAAAAAAATPRAPKRKTSGSSSSSGSGRKQRK